MCSLRCALLGLMLAAEATATWDNTIFTSTYQQMLIQKISVESLLLIDMDSDTNREQLQKSMSQFNSTLWHLLEGTNGVLPPPTPAARGKVQQGIDLWQPFRAVLDDILLIQNKSSLVPSLVATSHPLSEKFAELSQYLVNAAIATGAGSGGRLISLVERQVVLAYQMWKEGLLLGYDQVTVAELLDTKSFFMSAHRGLVDGATWLDVPKLTRLCALHAMREVTHYSDALNNLFSEIVTVEEEAQEKAVALAGNISANGRSLAKSMSNAVDYFLGYTACNITLTDLQWFNALTAAEDQLLQASEATKLFLQIALNYQEAEGKVELTVLSEEATVSLTNLVEGNKATDLPAPPTQELVDMIAPTTEIWQDMKDEFTKAIFTDTVPTSSVSEVVRLSKSFLGDMDAVVSTYVRTAILAGVQFPAYAIYIASQQRSLVQKLSKEACIVRLGYNVDYYLDAMTASRNLFVESHWKLLEGSPSTDLFPAVDATTNACIISQMWRIFGIYEDLERSAMGVASGELDSLSSLGKANIALGSQMQKVVNWVKAGDASCDPLSLSVEDWQGLILEVGRLRSMSQEASIEVLLSDASITNSSRESLNAKKIFVATSLRRLRFGSQSPRVPPPALQVLLDDFSLHLQPGIRSLEQALGGDDVQQVLQAGSWVMVEADQFLQRFFTEADAQASPVPLQRMNVADRQIALARQIFKEFLMTFVSQQSDPNITSSESLSQSISAFSTAHQSLRYGGNGIPELSPVRLDVQKQWETIGRAWSTFEAQLHEPPSWDELEKIQVDLTALVVELEVAVPLFAIKDEELRGDYLLPALVYSGIVVCMCVGAGVAIYFVRRHLRERSQPQADSKV
ncbi:unnamed protein product [Durusdinium trenchii]|uniref:Uncharacterized protein n=1 Tax=Durusdinium trenchii TaxID=1381693 RepID=A0ABP0NHU5_9DINO